MQKDFVFGSNTNIVEVLKQILIIYLHCSMIVAFIVKNKRQKKKTFKRLEASLHALAAAAAV